MTTVRELIEQLSAFDPDEDVLLDTGHDSPHITAIESRRHMNGWTAVYIR